MRIVSIGITLFLLLLGAVPFLNSRMTPGDAGFMMGILAAIVVFAFILGRVVWLLSDRKENAPHIGYCVGILLGIIVILGTFASARERALDKAKRKFGVWDPVSHVEKYLDGHPYGNAPSDTDEGRGYAATVQLLQDIRGSMTALIDAAEPSIKIRYDVVAQARSRQDLNEYKAVVARHERAAKECARYFTDLEAVLDERMAARGVDSDTRAKIRTDFVKGLSQSSAEVVELIKLHELIASQIGTLLDIMIAEWGLWKADPVRMKVLFINPETLKSVDDMIALIDDSRQQIVALSRAPSIETEKQ